MALTLGRLILAQPTSADSSSDGSASFGGNISSRDFPGDTASRLAAADLARRSLLELGGVIPLTWSEYDFHDGFYTVNSVSVTPEIVLPDRALYRWTADLTRLGGPESIEFETRLSGGTIPNDFALGGERWHAPPPAHTSYYLGVSPLTSITRIGSSISVPVYRSLPPDTDPLCALPTPSDLYTAAATISLDSHVTAATDPPVNPTTVALTNTLLTVSNATGEAFTVSRHRPATDSRDWRILVNDVAVSSWRLASILRNSPEQVAVRFYAPGHPVRLTLDVTLTRGARFAVFYLRRAAAATLRVARTTSETGNTTTPGTVTASTAVAGDRWVIGSSRTFTAFTASGGMARASTVDFDFFLGEEIGGASAQVGDRAADLMAQYLGSPSVTDTPVRR